MASMNNEASDTKKEEDNVWDSLTSPTHAGFLERADELKGLVHYTTFPTLQGLITNNELWFSPIATMNDFAEVSAGKHLLERLSVANGPLSNPINQIREFDAELWQKFNEAYQHSTADDLCNTFVSCWSSCDPNDASHDNLTMWRGYAAEGNGVAIVIDPLQLSLDVDFRSDIITRPVFYESEAEFAVRAQKQITHFFDRLQRLSSEQIARHEFHVVQAFVEICFDLAITHKHPGFAAEREWRFIWRRHRSDDEFLQSCVKPQNTARGMLEYLCLPLKKNPSLGPTEFILSKLVDEIMVGPTDDAFMKSQAVKSLLRHNGFDPSSTKVSISQIPYRAF